MILVRTPARVLLGAFTFAVVFVGFVASMRTCAKVLWPKSIATMSRAERAILVWESTHGEAR